MKKTLANVFSGVALLSMTGALYLGSSNSAEAGLIAWDDFNSYTAGTAGRGLNGGHGWAGAWGSAHSSDYVVVSDYSINYNTAGITRGGGNSINIRRDANDALSRQVFETKDTSGKDYFTSFVFQVRNANGTGGNSGDAFGTWAATDGRGANSVQSMTLGGIQGQRGIARVGPDNKTQGATANTVVYNETYFMVVGYSGWDSTTSTYTTSTVWLYDSNQTVISETTGLMATTTVPGAGSQGILGLQLRTHYLNTSASGEHVDKMFYFDDIRFGDSWDSVVTGAIPEASTTALIVGSAVSLVVLGLRRRKQSRVTGS